jgi:all-trans-8'-apo-beta-carotenal 15,15'-oxygenase
MDYWIDDWEGTIPSDLQGTFLQVGPSKYERGGVPIKCWLEGDGAMTAVSFKDGRVHVKARFVETKAYLEEKIENRFLYRGQFGTMKAGRRNGAGRAFDTSSKSKSNNFFRFRFPPINAFDMNFKNPSNTKPLYWGNRLLSTFETALPHELDPHTLQTKGEFTFGGLLKSGEAITSADPVVDAVLQRKSGHAFTAHARVDLATNRLVGWSWKTLLPRNWGLGFLSRLVSKKEGGAGLEVTFYEWNEEFDVAFPPVTIHVPGCPSPPHDWVITPNYYVWMQSAFRLNLLPCVLGRKGPGECMVPMKGEEARAVVHLIPRPGGKAAGTPPMAIEVDPYFMTHWSHGYDVIEEEGGTEGGLEGEMEKVVGYAAGCDKSLFQPANDDGHMFGHTYKGAPDFSRLPLIRYYRLDVDLREKKASFEAVGPLNHTFLDFPKVHPRYETRGEPRHVWAMACNDRGVSSPPQGYVHVDLKTEQVDVWHAPSYAAATAVAAVAAAAAAAGTAGTGGEGEVVSQMEAEDKAKHIVVGEGVLAPRALERGREGGQGQEQEEEELNCYWMGIEFDALTGRRSLCVFKAGEIGKGPLCKLHLKHRLPWGIHSEWVEGLEVTEPAPVGVAVEEEEEGGQEEDGCVEL